MAEEYSRRSEYLSVLWQLPMQSTFITNDDKAANEDDKATDSDSYEDNEADDENKDDADVGD
eukprot:15329904-Ditylum_brightwellii.AAC.1